MRIVVGIILNAQPPTGTIRAWGWIALLPPITGVVGWCGLNQVLGANSRSHQMGG